MKFGVLGFYFTAAESAGQVVASRFGLLLLGRSLSPAVAKQASAWPADLRLHPVQIASRYPAGTVLNNRGEMERRIPEDGETAVAELCGPAKAGNALRWLVQP